MPISLSTVPVTRPVETAEDVGARTEADEAMEQRVKARAERKAEPDPAQGEKRRPWGYEVPNGDAWQEKLDARLGISN